MNGTETLTVGPATLSDVDPLSALVAAAFHDLAPSRWLIDDPHARRQVLPGYFRLFVGFGLLRGSHARAGAPGSSTDPLGGQPFDGGQVYKATVDDELVGAAIWLPVVPGIPELPSSYDRALTTVTGRWSGRFQTFDLVLAQHHPDEPPTPAHAHLTMLAVAPGWQGRGIGSALLRAHHHLLDQHGTPGYLEAADQRSRRLYARHGYHDVEPWPLALPGGGPPMWPMWRDPA
jgi:ribosomal protein S18 acetylase RimI-like enzyme